VGIENDKVNAMGYNPYPPQQPTYDPYQQQYAQPYQQPYPAPGTVTAVPYAPPPPRKMRTSTKVIIIVVIVVVVMIVVSFIMAAILMVYMQDFSSGPGTSTPSISMVQNTFTNPSSSQTVNGGGWQLRVVAISGPASLSSVTVNIKSSGTTMKSLSAVSTTKSDLSYTAASMDWYLLKGGGSLKFVDGTTVKSLDSSTAKDLGAGDFETVQGATLIVIDIDGSGTLSAGDMVYVYSDIDGNGSPEIESGDQLELSMAGAVMGSVNLG
jgi:hypothetical protein